MNEVKKKNRRLCETLKQLNAFKVGQDVLRKEKHVKVKPKIKKKPQNTFSMINFYQSIPNYDEIRHLPEYDFSEKVDLLKKIHCDLSGTMLNGNCKRPNSSVSRSSKRKTSAKKKRDSANSLCNSASKSSMVGLNEVGSGNKQSPVPGISSANSFTLSTPSQIKHLQALRERLASGVDDWDFEPKPSPMPKVLSSPMCSPLSYMHNMHDIYYTHFHDFDPYPCDHVHRSHTLNSRDAQTSPIPSTNYLQIPPKQNHFPSETNSDFKSDEKLLMERKKIHRAKSCPKDLFSISSKCSEIEQNQNDSAEEECLRQLYAADQFVTQIPCRQRIARSKSSSKAKINPKTPTSMDEYLSAKLVRSNLAANLRQKNSRKKIDELAEEKLKETLHVSKFIPKCHHWNVRDTPAWKTFTSEDTTIDKRMRDEARLEEQKVRKHAHTMSMNIMRSRVKSAQLLLEGRSLSAK